jgi:hypothetical protein
VGGPAGHGSDDLAARRTSALVVQWSDGRRDGSRAA